MTGTTIEATALTKRYGHVTAVRDLTFSVRPGAVTGFLGPNGAGKTTTLRMILGLVTPTAGTVTIGGRPYRALDRPTSVVGAAFTPGAFHPGHTARRHLGVYAAMGGYPARRVGDLLDLLELTGAADRRIGTYSTGMRQRLALATALLGDPSVLLLDEPGNGLDPAGAAWLRALLRRLADEGRTVLVSSHVLGEVRQIADDVLVLHRGRLVAAGPWAELAGPLAVVVGTPDAPALARLLTAHALTVTPDGPHHLRVRGADAARIADLAAADGVRVHELRTEPADLERLFLDLTAEEAA
ncbi:ABC transporter ATP-binding protein [Actinocatenispora rupis]|uniref:ABC transporter ATP-binding protein n=1 Tax=Actinocatenispora rupis TaxID=519421 RepID=A0A8J3NDE9_9ACTN|nr:ATP-binding cassette domain-containing protein [Actinocatenispora rupis]GID14991.1 ABC transporter ATP-binding protein [Actinocatenispora rupis]